MGEKDKSESKDEIQRLVVEVQQKNEMLKG